MPSRFLAIIALLVAFPLCSRADGIAPNACVAGSVASMLDAPCTIGDKTFELVDFTGRLDKEDLVDPSQDTDISIKANQISFAPDASNPNSPGFTLSFGNLSSLSSQANEFNFLQIQVDYSVGITDPSSNKSIIGTTVTGTGLSATLGGSAGASNTLRDSSLTCTASASAQADWYSSPTYSLVTTATDDSLPADGCSGLTSVGGEILGGITTIDGGSGTVKSVSFFIDEGTMQTAREAPTFAPLALVILALIALARRKKIGRLPSVAT